MALTAAKVKDLEDAGFDELFDDHHALWEAKAVEAYRYARNLVTPTGEPVRPDDVIELLVPALVLAEELRNFLEQNRLTQKYWRQYFGEYILDRLWDDLPTAAQEETR
ncbi:MAG TPA: hypothetical protein VFU64_00150 [Gaiellaceae bacterium]|nr:hypothetical protein [Gaiellaceae bacterium]